jgi:hypothetical protein
MLCDVAQSPYTCLEIPEKDLEVYLAVNCMSAPQTYLGSSQSNPCTEENVHKHVWFWVLVVANAVQFITLISLFYCSICVMVLRRRRVGRGDGTTQMTSKESADAEPERATAMRRMRRSMMDMWNAGTRSAAPQNDQDRILASRAQNNAPTNQLDSIQSSSYIEVQSTRPLPRFIRN